MALVVVNENVPPIPPCSVKGPSGVAGLPVGALAFSVSNAETFVTSPAIPMLMNEKLTSVEAAPVSLGFTMEKKEPPDPVLAAPSLFTQRRLGSPAAVNVAKEVTTAFAGVAAN